MILLISTIALALSFYSGQAPRNDHNLIKFELRSAERDPGKELIEALVPKSDQRIFLHKEVLIRNVDIVAAQAVEDTSGFVQDTAGKLHHVYMIQIVVTPEGSERLAKASENHIGKPFAILFNEKVMTAPDVTERFSDKVRITGKFTREEAEKIADGIKRK